MLHILHSATVFHYFVPAVMDRVCTVTPLNLSIPIRDHKAVTKRPPSMKTYLNPPWFCAKYQGLSWVKHTSQVLLIKGSANCNCSHLHLQFGTSCGRVEHKYKSTKIHKSPFL